MPSGHSPTKKGKCEICLAGTILAVTYGINRDQVVIHECLGSELRPLAEALNLVRTGNWNLAFEIINFQPNTQELLDELHALPVPAHPHFYGWREFNHHLKSIEAALPRLRAIEEKFPAPPKPRRGVIDPSQ